MYMFFWKVSCPAYLNLLPWTKIQSDENSFLIGEIPDKAPKGLRKLPDQGWRRYDLLTLGQCRLLIDINDFKFITVLEMLLADLGH